MMIATSKVKDNELLANYIVEKKEYIINQGQLKGDAFIVSPNPQHNNRLEVSVIRYGTRDLKQMINCGKKWAKVFSKTLTGIGQMITKDVRDIKPLDVIHTPRPKWELLHSDIVHWDEIRYRVQAELLARNTKFYDA